MNETGEVQGKYGPKSRLHSNVAPGVGEVNVNVGLGSVLCGPEIAVSGGPAAMPVPLSATSWRPPAASSANRSTVCLAPALVGAKRACTVHDSPGVSGLRAEQLSLKSANWLGSAPAKVTDAMLTAPSLSVLVNENC